MTSLRFVFLFCIQMVDFTSCATPSEAATRRGQSGWISGEKLFDRLDNTMDYVVGYDKMQVCRS